MLIENRSGVATVEPGGRGLYFEQGRPLYPFEFNPYAIVNSGARIERHDLISGDTEVHIERPGGAFNPALSPDGRTLAYLNRDVDDTVLVLQNLETRRTGSSCGDSIPIGRRAAASRDRTRTWRGIRTANRSSCRSAAVSMP